MFGGITVCKVNVFHVTLAPVEIFARGFAKDYHNTDVKPHGFRAVYENRFWRLSAWISSNAIIIAMSAGATILITIIYTTKLVCPFRFCCSI